MIMRTFILIANWKKCAGDHVAVCLETQLNSIWLFSLSTEMMAWAYEGYPRLHFPPFGFSGRFPSSPGYHLIECCSATVLFHRFLSTTLVSYVWKSTTQSTPSRQTVILGQTRNFGRQSYGRSHLVKWSWEGLFFRSISSSQWRLASGTAYHCLWTPSRRWGGTYCSRSEIRHNSLCPSPMPMWSSGWCLWSS